ncbi:MAG: pseudouridine-5'-phosphate glycosidase [Chloroflexota bacterium]
MLRYSHHEDRAPTSSQYLQLSEEVRDAVSTGKPIVALETAVVTHGLPDPQNIQIARSMENAIRAVGAIPATCLIDAGKLWIGVDSHQVERIARDPRREKASVRDIGSALARCVPAGLTVSATLFAATLAGIRVFATGGIGGVHVGVEDTGDISADLLQLSKSPVVTVCAGAKSVLDIPRTVEYLETVGVPVFTYRQERFPGFYLRETGVVTPVVYAASEVANIAHAHWELSNRASIVVGNPVPEADAISPHEWDAWLGEAQLDAARDGIRGKDVTPYLLSRVAELSSGRTVRTNLALLESNARLAAEIALAFIA